MDMQFPHCDQGVLHAPKECEFCDEHPEWQALREAWRINFTGQKDPEKAPCPSETRRSLEVINMWDGNRPHPANPNEIPKSVYEQLLDGDDPF